MRNVSRTTLIIAFGLAAWLASAGCWKMVGSGSGSADGGQDGRDSGGDSDGAIDGATDGGRICKAPPPPSPTLPDEPGCYENDHGSGWVKVPCLCELWIENTTPGQAMARVELSVTPLDQAPAFDGTLDAEIAFDDPDASWYAIWAKQPGSGDAFTITNQGGKTTVQLAASSLTLGPVPLFACETRNAIAQVSGSYTETLSMRAILDDGHVLATIDGKCFAIPPE